MELFNRRKDVKLLVDDSLLEKLTKIAKTHYPKECGGFLVGYYSDCFCTLNITDFILPKEFNSSSVNFTRSTIGIKETLNHFFESKGHYYVGEWHTHPNGSSQYSLTDLHAMVEIVNCDTVQISNPILLILGIEEDQMKEFSFYIYNNKGLYKYE